MLLVHEAICSHELMFLCYNWYVFNQGHRFLCHELMRSHQMSAWSTLKHLKAFPGMGKPSSISAPSLPSPIFHLSPCILLIFPSSLFGSSHLAFVLGSIWWDYATSGSIFCLVIHFTSAYFWSFPEALTPVYRQTEPIQPPPPQHYQWKWNQMGVWRAVCKEDKVNLLF